MYKCTVYFIISLTFAEGCKSVDNGGPGDGVTPSYPPDDGYLPYRLGCQAFIYKVGSETFLLSPA